MSIISTVHPPSDLPRDSPIYTRLLRERLLYHLRRTTSTIPLRPDDYIAFVFKICNTSVPLALHFISSPESFSSLLYRASNSYNESREFLRISPELHPWLIGSGRPSSAPPRIHTSMSQKGSYYPRDKPKPSITFQLQHATFFPDPLLRNAGLALAAPLLSQSSGRESTRRDFIDLSLGDMRVVNGKSRKEDSDLDDELLYDEDELIL
jgi:hypothetical protein